MASRSNITPGIQLAQLDGRARYHLTNNTPREAALDDLRSIGAPPDQIREAADSARFRYLSDPRLRFQDGDVARLLEELL
ncbi:hypothetical protein GON03_03900 [Nocardioides sp. MAH-18]|uniref:Uncharacterized protein n=1 Tax=Nocardioides agri TaxID=2682843 RepID=A0A6L6XNC0_9ACTN|nr:MULTISPECIES: hypothetical protein [unclassified Nocardioides]MBA2953444.1 hypothetical protein [Nocardioides sp. CGMCC 1.13656]MVQ48312.1 hypothetical protein [Nocardioides sp. MAH-18]